MVGGGMHNGFAARDMDLDDKKVCEYEIKSHDTSRKGKAHCRCPNLHSNEEV